jgi:hypothetical protein
MLRILRQDLVVDAQGAVAWRTTDDERPAAPRREARRTRRAVLDASGEVGDEGFPILGRHEDDIEQPVTRIGVGSKQHVWAGLADVHGLDREQLARDVVAVQFELPRAGRLLLHDLAKQPQALVDLVSSLLVDLLRADESIGEDAPAGGLDECRHAA